MLSRQWFAIAALAALPCAPVALAAHAAHPHSSPADPDAAVGAIRYESAFSTYRGAEEESPPPDKAWRPANEKVGKLGGHAGHMKDAGGQGAIAVLQENADAAHAKHH